MRLNKVPMGVCAVAIAGLCVAGGFAVRPVMAALDQGKVVARINGASITQSDLDFVRVKILDQPENTSGPALQQGRRAAFQFLEIGALGDLQAKEDGKENDPVTQRISKLVSARVIGEDELSSRAKPDEAAVKARYNAMVASVKGKKDIAVSELRFRTEAEAAAAKAKVTVADFAATGKSGGVFVPKAYMQLERVSKAVAALVKDAKPGQILGPVKIGNSEALLKFEEIRDRIAPPFPMVRRFLEQSQRAEARAKVLEIWQKKWNVQILDAGLKVASLPVRAH